METSVLGSFEQIAENALEEIRSKINPSDETLELTKDIANFMKYKYSGNRKYVVISSFYLASLKTGEFYSQRTLSNVFRMNERTIRSHARKIKIKLADYGTEPRV